MLRHFEKIPKNLKTFLKIIISLKIVFDFKIRADTCKFPIPYPVKWSEARRKKCYNGFLKVVTNSHRLKFLFQVDGVNDEEIFVTFNVCHKAFKFFILALSIITSEESTRMTILDHVSCKQGPTINHLNRRIQGEYFFS